MKTIKIKISIAMLGLVLVVMTALTLIFMWFFQKSALTSLSSSIESQAKQSSINFNYFVQDSIHDVDEVVNSSAFHELTTDDERVDYLAANLTGNAYISSFAIFGTDGSVKAHVNNTCTKIVTPDDVALAAQRQDVYLTTVDNDEGSSCFCVLYPIIENGYVSRLACAAVDVQMINNSLSGMLTSNENSIMIVDRSGKVLFHTGDQATGRNFTELSRTKSDYADIADAVTTAISSSSGTLTYKFKGEKYVMGYESVAYFGGTLIVYSPNNADGSLLSGSTIRLIMLSIVLLVLVTVAVALLFSNSISKPIISTTDRLRKLSNGDISTRVDVWYSHDELGILSNSLEETVVNLRQYINLIQVALQQIAEGNLTHRMEGNFKGDFQRIKTTFNEIFEKLTITFDSINHSAEQVTSGAIQVSNSAQALSQGATQQASAIEELSATLSGVSDQVVQNSQNANDAFEIVSENTAAIAGCNDDMTKMLEAMELIDQTSEEIASILKVIDDISFQTNILALNAAVEAAREGSKGFGVVADEVRQLASRSAEAAKQTAALIKRSTDAVDQGQNIAKETANSLGEIVESSEKIRKLVKDIARASSEQSDSIQQINMGVDQISAVVSANTTTAVGSASASEELSGQSLILKNMIARVKGTDKDVPHIQHVEDDDDEPEDDGYRAPEDDPDEEDIINNIDNEIDDEDDKY